MAKLKQSLMVDGKKLSNKDPNLVITLESNPAVFIKEIGDDTITYGFNGFPDEDTTYTLNLTFTYMGLISYEVPLNIVQRALAEEPMIVDVKPITVEVDSAYQAPFRVILPVSGRELTSGFAIDNIVDNAGTHTSYLAKTNNMMFTVITADDDDISGVFKFTVSGTHAGKVYTLSADVPVTIKKWSKPDYAVKVHGGNDTPIISSLNKTGEFTYSLYKRNILVPNTEYVTDVALLNGAGTGLSNATDSAVDADSRKVSMTFIETSNGPKVFTVNDTNGVKLTTFTVMCLVDSGNGLSIRFPNDHERLLTGNVGDVIRISPVVTFDGEVIPNGDAQLTLTTEKSVTDETAIPNITIVGKSGTGWDVKLNAPVVSNVDFLWVVKYTPDTGSGARIAGGLTVYAATASQIQMSLIDVPSPNVVQSLRLKLEQPVYGSGPNWSVKGAKVDKLIGKFFDTDTGTQVGEDFTLGSRTADQTGVVQIDLPRAPYKETRFEISGNVSPKWGKDGEGSGYTSVPGVFTPVVISAVPVVASTTENRINYFNNSATKVIFKLTQEQGDTVVPINAVDVTELVLTGKGFTSDTVATKEPEDGTYSFTAKGMGEQGDVDVSFKVQSAVGVFETVSLKLRAVKILPTVVDAPITPAMWAYGNNPPFKVMLGATDVTSQITNLKVGVNQYVIPDPSPGTGQKVWHVLYAEKTPTPVKVPFTYNLVVDGVQESFTAEGTFNLPAWDGIAAKVVKGSMAGASFDGGRVKIGSSISTYVLLNFKGGYYGDADKVVLLDAQSELHGGTSSVYGPGHNVEGRNVIITPKELGKQVYKLAIGPSSNMSNGYPLTEGLGYAFWEPEIEVWDDVLAITPKTQTVEATEMKNVEIPFVLTWNDQPLPLATTGVVITNDNPLFVFQNYTATGIVYKVNKEVLVPETQECTITASYGGKTDTAKTTVNIIVDQFKQLQIVDNPISAKIWDSGTAIPFQLMDDGVDITDTMIDLDFEPNQYIIKNPEGEGWYVDSAETVAKDVKVKYTFKLEKNGVQTSFEYQATFKLAAWDGITLKVNAAYGIVQNEFSVMLNGTNSYTFYPTFKGKPAGNDVVLESITGLVNGGVTIENQEIVEDGKGVRVTIRGTGKTGANTALFRYRMKGTTGGVINKDYADHTGISLPITTPGIYFVNATITPNPVNANGLSRLAGQLYYNGVRINHNDPNLTLVMKTISGLDYLGAAWDAFYARVTVGSKGSYTSTYYFRYNDNGNIVTTTDYNWNISTSGTVGNYVSVNTAYPGVPAVDNEIEAPLYLRPANTLLTDVSPVIPYKITKNPDNGNAVVDPSKVEYVYKDGKMMLLFPAGHTGDSFQITGIVRTPQGTLALVPSTHGVPKSPVVTTNESSSYPADENKQVKIKFKLNQARYGAVSHDFTGAIFEAVTITGATGSGQITKEADGWFSTVVDVTVSGNVTIAGKVKDTDSWSFPFTVTAAVTREVDVKVTPKQLNVKVWDVGGDLPFTVTADGTDVTNTIQVIEFTPTEHVKKRTALPNPEQWVISSEEAMSGLSETVNYTFRLAGEDSSVVRTASGTFNIADYDGKEFEVYYLNNSGGVSNNVLFVVQNNTNNPRVILNAKGKFRGEVVEIENVSTFPTATTTGPLRLFTPATPSGLVIAYEAQAFSGTGGVTVRVTVKRKGTAGTTEGMDVGTFTIPASVYASGSTAYSLTEQSTLIEGKLGDEIYVRALVTSGATVVDLTNPTHLIQINAAAKLEFVPGSLESAGFKVRFKEDVLDDTTGKVNISITNSVDSNKATSGTWDWTQHTTLLPLELGDGFITVIEGDKDTPATVKQGVVLPS